MQLSLVLRSRKHDPWTRTRGCRQRPRTWLAGGGCPKQYRIIVYKLAEIVGGFRGFMGSPIAGCFMTNRKSENDMDDLSSFRDA